VRIDRPTGKAYLTKIMNALTIVSTKGQIVIPKDVRDRLKFAPGTALEVIESEDSVTFRLVRQRKTKTFEECEAIIRTAIKYDGPVGLKEDWRASIAQRFRDHIG
jgi:AbrB family looped-hinge helix DNA binding protein